MSFLIPLMLNGQSHFVVEGKRIETGTIIKTYNFSYEYNDTLSLYSDSCIEYINAKKTIIKKISYSNNILKKPNFLRINYKRANGQDSISKHFEGDKIAYLYEFKYDKLNREIYYRMKDLRNKKHDSSFEWYYEYRDSISKNQKFTIQTKFIRSHQGKKKYDFKVIYEYDDKNRKIRETRKKDENDVWAQDILYKYNENDSLISETINGKETNLHKAPIDTLCSINYEYNFEKTDFYTIKDLVSKIIEEHKGEFKQSNCEVYAVSLTSKDKQTKLVLLESNNRDFNRKVYFTTEKHINGYR